MTLDKAILLNPTTIRLHIDFSGKKHHFDIPLSQIAAMDAAGFATWALANLTPPAQPIVPSWLSDMIGTTL
jgi:hypothetical protein